MKYIKYLRWRSKTKSCTAVLLFIFAMTTLQLLMEWNSGSMTRHLEVNSPSVCFKNTNLKDKHMEPLQLVLVQSQMTSKVCEFYLFVHFRRPSPLQYFSWPVTSGPNKRCGGGRPCPHDPPHRGDRQLEPHNAGLYLFSGHSGVVWRPPCRRSSEESRSRTACSWLPLIPFRD